MPAINEIKLRRGTSEQWSEIDPVLAKGEPGLDTTNNLIKIGNGLDSWNLLPVFVLATPIVLLENTAFINKITIRSPIIDFKNITDAIIFEVPENHMFSIDSMEILTTEISDPQNPPFIRFGNLLNFSAYYSSSETVSNKLGERHIIENSQDYIEAGTVITFGITAESTATSHRGCGIISGNLLKIS